MSVEDVLALAGPDPPAGARRPVGGLVGPVAAVVLRVGRDRLVAAPGGRPVVVGSDGVRVLDALDGPTPVSVVGEEPSRRAALERLIAAGLVRVLDGPLDSPDSDVATATREASPDGSVPMLRDPADRRVPVYAAWHTSTGPMLSLGMLTAAARHHAGGALAAYYDIRPPEEAASVLEDLTTRDGPAVLLCSDYVFTIEQNLELARKARALRPELVVVHGGPSAPRFEGDAIELLDRHGDAVHVLVRGEGEVTLCELLDALSGSLPDLDADRLSQVDGITFRDPESGSVLRTRDRARVVDLDSLPSPYLSGEFDHLRNGDWTHPPFFETNRGCPYGCTFCDWGSATRSRIRWFDLDRVGAEFEWAGRRGLAGAYLCDANFGIHHRDVEVAEMLAAVRRRCGAPRHVMFSPAKNTTKHLSRILDVLFDADIEVATSISLQTTDPATLAAVGRHNISTDGYLALAADLRRRGHPLVGDLILGLPGQTYESYRADLQFMLDHEIMPRTFSLRRLPNAPMNDPEYRTRHRILTDENQVVVATATMTPAERARGLELRNVEAIVERYGVLRHVMRFLQWDHGIPATAFMEALMALVARDPERVPSLAWLLTYFDLFAAPPSGWPDVFAEAHHVVVEDLGVVDDSALRCVLALQEFLMPAPGRGFPATRMLEHDYVAYYSSATADLYGSGQAGRPERPLIDYPPSEFQVEGDPLDLCGFGLDFPGDSRDEVMEGDFAIGSLTANELDSPLVRLLPPLGGLRSVIERKLATATAPR